MTDQDSESEEDDSWNPFTVHLTDAIHEKFSETFWLELKIEYDFLRDLEKREYRQAAIEVAMEHPEEVVEKAREYHEE